jgi:flagellar hook-basal body complex protein FliE
MNAGRIGEFSIKPLVGEATRTGGSAGPVAGGSGPSFGEALESALKTVDGNLQQADAGVTSYVGGGNVDLHNVMMDLERADLGFRTMVQVRNKLLDAYKEVMRIPV